MIYFCADDYGLSKESNRRIEQCLSCGILNKTSILPNGVRNDFQSLFSIKDAVPSFHINLVEGRPLSSPSEISLLVSDDGHFRYSFIGLYFLSLSPKRKELEKQLYTEIINQIRFMKKHLGEDKPFFIDSHQHTHMIPLIFKTLLRALDDEKINADYLRIPSEPLSPYILTPSLYLSYSPSGLIKQWLLRFLAFTNGKKAKKANIPSAYFLGVLFSGRMSERVLKKLLPKYIKLAEKKGKNIEIGFHPGCISDGDETLDGIREGFRKFYLSPNRNIEYDTLMNFKFDSKK